MEHLRLNQIEKINEKEYEEKIITSILPNWDKNITGVHTFQYDKGLSIIDAKIKRRR